MAREISCFWKLGTIQKSKKIASSTLSDKHNFNKNASPITLPLYQAPKPQNIKNTINNTPNNDINHNYNPININAQTKHLLTNKTLKLSIIQQTNQPQVEKLSSNGPWNTQKEKQQTSQDLLLPILEYQQNHYQKLKSKNRTNKEKHKGKCKFIKNPIENQS